MKKSNVELKRRDMPEPKMRVTDYDEADPAIPDGPHSPAHGTTSPRNEQSRTNSKEQVKRSPTKRQKSLKSKDEPHSPVETVKKQKTKKEGNQEGSFFSDKHMVESMTTPMKKEMKSLNYHNSLRHAHTSGKQRDDLPKDANSMYASYMGTYSKNYKPSFDGTFRDRTTQAASVFTGQTVTREEHNQ